MDDFLRSVNDTLQHTQVLLMGALIIARTVPMVVQTPFLGGQIIPMEIKMGMSVLLTVLVWPLATPIVTDMPTQPIPYLLLMMKETLIGFAMGFVNSHIFFALDMAGRFIDTARGVSMSEVMDPHSKKRVTPTGDLYTQMFLVIFMAIGGHRVFFETFFFSFKTLPIDKGLAFANNGLVDFFEHTMRLGGEIWVVSVVLSAPIIAATLLTDVVFGILNRVAPQLNAYFMAMPVKAYGGIMIIFVSMGAIVDRFAEYVVWMLVALEKTLELMF